MCNFSGKLVAWFDHELPELEAGEVERHVKVCTECRAELERYGQVSRAFDAYCNAAMAPKVPGLARQWVRPMAVAAAAAAAAVLLFLSIPRVRIEKTAPVHDPGPTVAQATRLETGPVALKTIHRYAIVRPVRAKGANWTPAVATVEIAIPAEEMYPPGAVPEGMSFIVDFRIAADGSTQQIGLWP